VPEALNLDLLREHILLLRSGKSIEKPVYDMRISEPVGTEKVAPKKIIIVEGLFALDERLKDLGDVKVFVKTSTHRRIIRRLLRDVQRAGQRPVDILKYFCEVVEPMHERYVENTKKNADFIINNEYNPRVEAECLRLYEVQLKLKGDITPDNIKKLGAEELGCVMQVDRYYSPKNGNSIQTEEILRIREEGNKIILTYKGPKIDSNFRKRPVLEFDIDEETEKAFLDIYGNLVKTIRKERRLYKLGDVILSRDRVWKEEDGRNVELGNFIEIKSNKELSQEKVESIIRKLGFDASEAIKESYFEM
jgi:predicted adenylyl cyclase CyaB